MKKSRATRLMLIEALQGYCDGGSVLTFTDRNTSNIERLTAGFSVCCKHPQHQSTYYFIPMSNISGVKFEEVEEQEPVKPEPKIKPEVKE